MSVRSLALGLVAAAPLAAAAPHWGWYNQDYAKTITLTETVSACPSTSHSSSHSTSYSTSYSSSHSSSHSSTAGSATGTSATSVSSSASSATSAPATTTAATTSSNSNPSVTLTATAAGTSGMQDAAKAAGKIYMGTAVDYPGTGEGADPYYLAELANQHDFGGVTPANIMKWEFVEPEQGVFNFTGGDEFVALAKKNNQVIRCHNLNWYNQNPAWLTNTNWNKTGLLAALENHITQTITHFGDNCYAWDVVNEAFNDDGTYREDIWYNVTGTDYLFTAFRTAEAAVKANNLKVKLYYNDYNIEYPGNKSTSAQNLVKAIKAQGIQIDGVGLQSHFIVGETPSAASQIQNMNAFTALDVDVAVTELDIRTNTPATVAAQQQQVLDYASTVAACHNVTRCVGVTVWDFDDTYSWIPSTFAGQGWGDLFFQPNGSNTPLVRKAAYDGVLYGWQGVVPTLGTQ